MAKDHSGQKRVAIYLRVSTGEQTTENQRRELEAVAARHGWRVVEFFEDAGRASSLVGDLTVPMGVGATPGTKRTSDSR